MTDPGERLKRGAQLKALRAATNLKRQEFAAKIGIPYDTLRKWEEDTRTISAVMFEHIKAKAKEIAC